MWTGPQPEHHPVARLSPTACPVYPSQHQDTATSVGRDAFHRVPETFPKVGRGGTRPYLNSQMISALVWLTTTLKCCTHKLATTMRQRLAITVEPKSRP